MMSCSSCHLCHCSVLLGLCCFRIAFVHIRRHRVAIFKELLLFQVHDLFLHILLCHAGGWLLSYHQDAIRTEGVRCGMGARWGGNSYVHTRSYIVTHDQISNHVFIYHLHNILHILKLFKNVEKYIYVYWDNIIFSYFYILIFVRRCWRYQVYVGKFQKRDDPWLDNASFLLVSYDCWD